MIKEIVKYLSKREIIEDIIKYKNENFGRFLMSSKEDIAKFIVNINKRTYPDIKYINDKGVIFFGGAIQ